MADGSPCLFTNTRTPVDVAWESLEQSETTLRRLIEAVGPKSPFHGPLTDALNGLKDYAFDALHELRMEPVEKEVEEEEWPKPLAGGQPFDRVL